MEVTLQREARGQVAISDPVRETNDLNVVQVVTDDFGDAGGVSHRKNFLRAASSQRATGASLDPQVAGIATIARHFARSACAAD